MLENKKFSQLDEARQSQDGLDLVLSGEKDGTYKNQFSQLSTAIKAAKDKKGQWSNTVIKYADGTEMIRIYWYRDANGKFDDNSLTWDASKTEAAPSPTPTDASQAEYSKVAADSETLVDLLDAYTTEAGMKEIYDILAKYNGKKVKNSNGKAVDALGLLSFYYADNEGGDQLWRDVANVGVATWTYSGGGKTNKESSEKILKPYQNETIDTLKTKYFD